MFRTHDPDHERLVAVKAFSLDLTPEQTTGLSDQFQRLVDLGIEHPYIAAPVAAGVEDFVAYLAVPYVAGESLDAAIRQYGPAPAGDAIRLVSHLAEALDAAAALGVFHGSLHPRDVLVTPGETHVTGLGITQALERIGLHGPIRRPYVAPERESGDEWGAAADIYALAAVAYEVLTGRRALPGTDQPLAALSDLRIHDAVALKDVIETALDPDPERRPAGARDFATAFAAALSETADSVIPGGRGLGHRPRKARPRPPKLPGLDEPLLPAEPARPAVGSVAAASTRPSLAPAELPTVALTVPAAALDSVAAVTTSGPAVAAESAPAETVSGSADGAPPAPEPDVVAGPAAEIGATAPPAFEASEVMSTASESAAVGPPGAQPVVSNTTPSEDASVPLSEPATVSAGALAPPAADTDTPVFDPGASAFSEDLVGPDVSFDLEAESQLAVLIPIDFGESSASTAATPTGRATPTSRTHRDLSLNLSRFDEVGPTPSPTDDLGVDLDAFDFSFPPEASGVPPSAEPTPAVQETVLRLDTPPVAGRRLTPRMPTPARTPIRVTPAREDPSRAGSSPTDTQVPRAFEPGPGSPPSRPSVLFDSMPPASSDRPSWLPIMAGVAAGLVIGLAMGYWLGSGSAATGTAPSGSSATAPRTLVLPSVPPAGGRRDQPASQLAATQPGEAKPPVTAGPASPSPAAGEAASRPALPSGPAVGEIAVRAMPLSANVFLDGQRDGLTPRTLRKVPLGTHMVRVTRPAYATQEQEVVLTARKPSAMVEFTLRPGKASAAGTARDEPAAPAKPTARLPAPPKAAGAPQSAPTPVLVVPALSIETRPPGARVRVDGRDVGVTPLTVTPLVSGWHTVQLQLAGYRVWSSTVSIAAGQRRRIAASLEREPIR